MNNNIIDANYERRSRRDVNLASTAVARQVWDSIAPKLIALIKEKTNVTVEYDPYKRGSSKIVHPWRLPSQ